MPNQGVRCTKTGIKVAIEVDGTPCDFFADRTYPIVKLDSPPLGLRSPAIILLAILGNMRDLIANITVGGTCFYVTLFNHVTLDEGAEVDLQASLNEAFA
jgi:hypothetical protein